MTPNLGALRRVEAVAPEILESQDVRELIFGLTRERLLAV
jgi:hypothetical protein